MVNDHGAKVVCGRADAEKFCHCFVIWNRDFPQVHGTVHEVCKTANERLTKSARHTISVIQYGGRMSWPAVVCLVCSGCVTPLYALFAKQQLDVRPITKYEAHRPAHFRVTFAAV